MADVTDPVAVARRVEEVRARVRELTDRSVTLVAVTKGFGVEAARAAVAAGVVDIGENYAAELGRKATELAERPVPGAAAVRWHMIGRLQRNKVRHLAPVVALWQSVDRVELGAEIARRAPGAAVLVQLAVSGASGQGGIESRRAPELVEALRGMGLDVRGVMAIGPRAGREEVGASFALARGVADDLGLEVRSFGMSGDFETAVVEGSTMVRLGRALFGPRPGSGEPPGVAGLPTRGA